MGRLTETVITLSSRADWLSAFFAEEEPVVFFDDFQPAFSQVSFNYRNRYIQTVGYFKHLCSWMDIEKISYPVEIRHILLDAFIANRSETAAFIKFSTH